MLLVANQDYAFQWHDEFASSGATSALHLILEPGRAQHRACDRDGGMVRARALGR